MEEEYGICEMLSLILYLASPNNSHKEQKMWQLRWDSILTASAQKIGIARTRLANVYPTQMKEYFKEALLDRDDISQDEKDHLSQRLKELLPLPVWNVRDIWDLIEDCSADDFEADEPWDLFKLFKFRVDCNEVDDRCWQFNLYDKNTDQSYGLTKPWDYGRPWDVASYEEFCLYLILYCNEKAIYHPQIGESNNMSELEVSYFEPGELCIEEWHEGNMIDTLKIAIKDLERVINQAPNIRGARNIVNDLTGLTQIPKDTQFEYL